MFLDSATNARNDEVEDPARCGEYRDITIISISARRLDGSTARLSSPKTEFADRLLGHRRADFVMVDRAAGAIKNTA